MDDDPADVKDPLLLLNTLNAGSPSYKIHNKRRLIPNFEVERQACGDVKKLKLKVPAQKLRNPSDDIIMVSPTGEIIPKKEWVDTEAMVDELVNFMKVYKVPQARIARKLEIGQMWLSRMICAPRQYDILQEVGRAQCRKLWGWLQIPEKERALEILNDQQADGKLLSFMHYISDRVEQDDNEEVDTIEMVRQMQEEMETYNVSVSDYAKGSGVKYSWVYALVNKPNVYDSFNVSGKKQARLLNRYLNLPLNQRAEMWKFTKDEPKGASLDTEDIRRRVEERLQRQNLPSQILCVQLQIDYPRFQQLFLQPIPWEHLNLPGRRVFSKLNDWLQSRGDDMQGVKTEVADEKEEEEEDVIFHPTTTKKIVDNGNFYHSLDTFSLIKNVKREMKLLKLTPLQLGDHLNIRNLQDLMQNTGRWDKVDESMKEEYHLLNKWMASNPDKRIMEAQIIQGTFDPTTNYAQKLLAEQMRHEEDTLEPLITPQIKEEPGEKDNKPATSTTTPTARQAWQTARPPETRLPPVTRIVTLGFRSTKPPTKRIIPVPKLRPDVTNVNPNNDITITVDLPETAELIKAATLLIEQRIAFSVGLDKISMKSPREDVSHWLSFFTENGFVNVHVSC